MNDMTMRMHSWGPATALMSHTIPPRPWFPSLPLGLQGCHQVETWQNAAVSKRLRICQGQRKERGWNEHGICQVSTKHQIFLFIIHLIFSKGKSNSTNDKIDSKRLGVSHLSQSRKTSVDFNQNSGLRFSLGFTTATPRYCLQNDSLPHSCFCLSVH